MNALFKQAVKLQNSGKRLAGHIAGQCLIEI